MSDPILAELQKRAALAMSSKSAQEGVGHLSEAFAIFCEETSRLKTAHANLQERLQSVNQDLTRATQTLDNILRHIAQGILFVSTDGRIALLNEAACRLLAVANNPGGSFWSAFPDDLFGFSLKEALAFGHSHRLLYKTIQAKELEISTTFISEGPKSAHGLVILLRDISEQQRLQRLANQSDRMKELGEMAATVAHEIRNPLGGIRGYATLLYRDLANEKHLQEMAGHVIEGTKSLEHLVSQVLHYARAIKIHPQSVELGAFLRQIGKFVRIDPAFPENVKLEIHIPQDPLLAPVDPDALKSCLLNLIYNAFQAMPQGGALQIALMRLERTCQISITDTGVGIDPQHLSQLFSPFFTTKQTGTGLGLVEARKIAEAHNGHLDVRSQQGRGTTFTLHLPLMRIA